MAAGHNKKAAIGQRPESPFFRRWAEGVIRLRWPLLLGNLLLTAFFAVQATTLKIDTSTDPFMGKDAPATLANEALRDHFGQDVVFKLLIEGDVFSEAYLDRLRALHTEVESLDMELASLGQRRDDVPHVADAAPAADDEFAGLESFGDEAEGWGDEAGGSIVEQTTSIINVRQTRWHGGGLLVEGLMDARARGVDLSELKRRALSDPTIVGRLLGEDATHSVVVVRTDFMDGEDAVKVRYRLREIADRHDREGFRVRIGGFQAVFATLLEVAVRDMQTLAGASLLAMIAVLTWVFRHPLGILGPVLAVAQSALWMLGTMALVGMKMTGITNILPAFLMCVGIGDAVHIQSAYRTLRGEGVDNHEAIVRAVATTGMPVFFTTITTAFGLFSFVFATGPAIRELGVCGGYGVCLAMLQCLVLVPIVLSFNRRGLLGGDLAARTGDPLDRFLDFCERASRPVAGHMGRARLLTGLALLLAVISVVGAGMLRTTHDPLRDVPLGAEALNATLALDEHVGGTSNIALLIEAGQGSDLKRRDSLRHIEHLEQHIHDYRHGTSQSVLVENSTSVLDVLRESWRAVHEDSQAHYALPDSQRGVHDMYTLFQNSGPEQLRRLITLDMRTAVMVLRVRWLDASSYEPLTRHIHAGIDALRDSDLSVRTTGTVFTLFAIAKAVIVDLVRSFGTAAAVITVFMVLLLGEWRLGLVAMLPNLLPIAVVLGGMGWLSVPMDFSSVLIASVAIGIAVDDTIHFLYQYRAYHRQGGQVEGAIRHAFHHSGRAMAITSLTLVIGFSVYLVADARNVQRFGVLIASTVVVALLIDLLFTPALLRLVFPGSNSSTDDRAADEPRVERAST